MGGISLVSDMVMHSPDGGDELHDLDLIEPYTCKGDPPPDPKRVKAVGPPESKARPPVPTPPNVDRDALIAAIQTGVLSATDVEFAVRTNSQLALSSSGPMLSG